MGSTSPGLSSLAPGRLLLPPNDTVLRTGLEKVAAGAGVEPGVSERRDWSPSPPATPEQGLSTFYLSYFDMLCPDDSSWVAKAPGASSREESPEEPEQCPVIDSQAPGGGLDLVPGGLNLEEHSLEQVQSMVVGEVLKDIETACKLLNITAGEFLALLTISSPPTPCITGPCWLNYGRLRAHLQWPQWNRHRQHSTHYSWERSQPFLCPSTLVSPVSSPTCRSYKKHL